MTSPSPGPPTLDPSPKAVAFARSKGSRVAIERDPLRRGGEPDVVTDTRISMHDPQSARGSGGTTCCVLSGERGADGGGGPEALFMHCLPRIGRGVTSAVMDGPASGGLRRGGEPAACPEGDPALVHWKCERRTRATLAMPFGWLLMNRFAALTGSQDRLTLVRRFRARFWQSRRSSVERRGGIRARNSVRRAARGLMAAARPSPAAGRGLGRRGAAADRGCPARTVARKSLFLPACRRDPSDCPMGVLPL